MSRELLIVVSLLFAVGAVLMALTHRGRSLDHHRRQTDWIKYAVFVGYVGCMLAVVCASRFLTALVIVIVTLLGAKELLANVRKQRRSGIWQVLVWSAFVFIGLAHLSLVQQTSGTGAAGFLFVIVAVTDSFSQIWGRLLGSRKLCPHLSPGKTVEGLVLGLLSAVICAKMLCFLIPGQSSSVVVGLGLIAAVAAVAGDLIFSAIKRHLAIKDFSNVLPGHGGVLDRFDSLIVATPVFYWIQKLIVN